MSRLINVSYLSKQLLFEELSQRGYNVAGASRHTDFTKEFLMDVYDGYIWLPEKTNEKLKLRAVAPRKEAIFNEL